MVDFKVGAIQSPPDPRDYIYKSFKRPVGLPNKFSRRHLFGPARDQGPYGTCVGFGAGGVKDGQEAMNYPGRGLELSPLYIYTYCKQMDGMPAMEGTYPRVAMQVLHTLGVCKEGTFPYSQKGPGLNAIPPGANEEAKEFKIGAYARVQSIEEIKQALVEDGPVLAGVLVCDNFMYPEPGGMIDMPEGILHGGHAVCVVGYDNTKTWRGYMGFFEVRNSWGPTWGDGGYCWIPYKFLDWRSDLGQTAWMESWSSVDIVLPPPQAKEIIMWAGQKVAKVDGKDVQLDMAPYISPGEGRTVVPIRFVAENMGYIVEWEASTKRIRMFKA
jgi:hypothetical protein